MQVLRNIGIAAIVYVVGVASGVFLHSQIAQTSVIKQQEAATKKTANIIDDSTKKSAEIGKEVEKIDDRSRDVAERTRKHLEKTQPVLKCPIQKQPEVPGTPDQPKEQDHGSSYSDIHLDRGTVFLLNEARSDGQSASGPASAGDAESAAPSSTSLTDFILSDIDVARRYNELAKRHNELVDYVQSLIDKQAKPND